MPPQNPVYYDDNGNPISNKAAPVFYDDDGNPIAGPKSFKERTQDRLAKTFAQQDTQAENVRQLTRDPATMASMAASVVAPERKLLQAGLQGLGGVGAGLYKGESVGEALGHGAEAAGIPVALEGLQRAVNVVGPKMKQWSLDLGKSIFKVRDPVAKMAGASEGGRNLDAGVNEVIETLAEERLLAPTAKNRTKAFDLKRASGQAVEKAWLTPPERPVGITREDRLLPSHATGVEVTPLHTPEQAPFQGAVPARTEPNPLAARYPYNMAPANPAGAHQPPQYMGEAIHETPTRLPDTPGTLVRDTPPRVVPGQPFDTVARDDIIRSIDADIAAAERLASPTTGLKALRGRWEIMPEFVDRKTARGVVKGINMRLAPQYHNALNDPVAVAAEKGVGRQITGEMMTPEMEAANARYAKVKPAALAVSHAAKRAGARDIIGLKGTIQAGIGAQAGAATGGPFGALAGGLGGLGLAVASHPIPQGHVAQMAYDIGKALPASMRAKLGPDLMRTIQLALLAQQQEQP